MIDSVEANLKNTKEEQKLNEEFERHIRTEVYRMHGISEDKLQGMEERRNAWYQGAAFALFFLSLILVAVCGVLHGFGSELCIFMAFYTAIEGTLLSNGRKQAAFFEVLIKVLYLLLYPVMLTVFVCYELKFKEYDMLVPIFVIAGVVVLMLGAVSYFAYDPYRVDKRNRKKANSYIKEMEKAALKEVRLKEKALEKEIEFRNITGIRTALAKKDINRATIKIKEQTVDTVKILSVATLHDEFGFGEKRMQRFMGRLKEKHQKVLKGDGTGDGGKDL